MYKFRVGSSDLKIKPVHRRSINYAKRPNVLVLLNCYLRQQMLYLTPEEQDLLVVALKKLASIDDFNYSGRVKIHIGHMKRLSIIFTARESILNAFVTFYRHLGEEYPHFADQLNSVLEREVVLGKED